MTTGLEEILQQQEEDEAVVPPDTTETGKEEVVEETPAAEAATEAEEVPAIAPENNELNELRQFIREQRKEIAAMKAKLGRVKESSEVDDDGKSTIVYSNLEKLQMELHNVAVSKSPVLEVLVEAMEANPKYSDIREVCTKSHFDDIFEMAASNISRQEGKDFNEVLLELELEVWNKTNPYKYMYSIIKDNHPKYKGKEKEKETTPIKPITAKKAIEAKEIPGSIAALGAGDTGNSGVWTAAKIDALDESELHKVPEDVYNRYMMGKLN